MWTTRILTVALLGLMLAVPTAMAQNPPMPEVPPDECADISDLRSRALCYAGYYAFDYPFVFSQWLCLELLPPRFCEIGFL